MISSGASVSLSYVKIQNIKSTIANDDDAGSKAVDGIGLSVTLAGSDASLCLTHVKFSGLRTEGNGGLYVNYEGREYGEYSDVVFSDCSSTGSNTADYFYIVVGEGASEDDRNELKGVIAELINQLSSKGQGLLFVTGGEKAEDLCVKFVYVTDGISCTSGKPCTLHDALTEANTLNGEVTLNIKDITDVKENIIFDDSSDGTSSMRSYIVKKGNEVLRSVSLNMKGGSIISKLPLTITDVSIIIKASQSGTAITQENGMLTISGTASSVVEEHSHNENEALIIGGMKNSVKITDSLVKIIDQGKITLSNVIFKNI